MVEHLVCNQGVVGSSPVASTSLRLRGCVSVGWVLTCPAERGARSTERGKRAARVRGRKTRIKRLRCASAAVAVL